MSVQDHSGAELLGAPPTLSLKGKVVWITGASRGLGRAIAYGAAGAGAEVVVSARSREELEATARTIRDAGGVAHAVAGSIAEPGHAAEVMDLVGTAWGRLDAVVNNAGISPSFMRSERVEADEFHEVMTTNLWGPLQAASAAFELLAEGGGGSVVNISSVHGLVGHPRLATYSMSKGGLELLTRTLAIEWASRNVRVNTVAPGYLVTEMTSALRDSSHWAPALLGRIPMGRFAQPSEIVGSVLFLAGPASSYVTGATLVNDGGWTAQ